MAESIFRGPVVSVGSLMDGQTPAPADGPSINYQGSGFPDPRFPIANKDGQFPGRITSFAATQRVVLTDTIIQTATATGTVSAIAISSTVVPGQLSLASAIVTTSAGGSAGGASWTWGVPFIPFGSNTVTTVGVIDFGFTTGTTVANSSALVVLDSNLFERGEWIVIGGAGNVGLTAALVTQVQSTRNATTIEVLPVALGALTNAPVGHGNAYGTLYLPPVTQFGPGLASANAARPYMVGGLGAFFDAREASSRGLTVQAHSTVGGTTQFTVRGYDVYGVAMSETIASANGATMQFGKKAFKYISSITALGTGVATYFIGISDMCGINLRAETWDPTFASYNNVRATSANGYTTSFSLASTANATSQDVRGLYQISTVGSLATSLQLNPSNGTGRLFIALDVRLPNLINADSISGTASLFGAAQA
jgi:hypothetical protein